MRPRRLFGSILVLVGACKIEHVHELPPAEQPSEVAHDFWSIPLSKTLDEEQTLVDAELRRHMVLLTSPFLAGRRPGSDGAALTADHLERSMSQIDLVPAGVGGGWRQPVVVRIRELNDARIELPGAVETAPPEVISHGHEVLIRREDVVGPWSEEWTIVDAGFGITAPDLGYDDYASLDAKGKLLLVRDGVPADDRFSEAAGEAYGSRDYKFERARRVGAAGCIIATGVLQRDAAWARLQGAHERPEIDTGAQPVRDRDRAKLPFTALLSAEGEARVRAWIAATGASGAALRPIRVVGATVERSVIDPNIIGRIPGHDRPEEVVVVLAHWDAGGTAAVLPEGGGATDNATGVAALLAVARESTDWVRRGRRPARSILFAVTASDGLELAGTRALFETGLLSRSRVVGMFALDALSMRPSAVPLAAVGSDRSDLAQVWDGVQPGLRTLGAGEGPHPRLAHEVALLHGVPAVTLTRHDPASPGTDHKPEVGEMLVDLNDDVGVLFDAIWGLADSAHVPEIVRTGEDAAVPERTDRGLEGSRGAPTSGDHRGD